MTRGYSIWLTRTDFSMALAVGNPDISSDLWQSALDALERKFSKPIFEMWIKPLRLVSLSGDELRLAVQNNFARDWVENRLKGQIYEVLAEISEPACNCNLPFSPKRRRLRKAARPRLRPPRFRA